MLLPGLGQLYAGSISAAVGAYVATLCAVIVLVALCLWAPGGPAAILVGCLVAVGTFVAVIVHAWRFAARQPADFRLRPYNRWYVYAGVYLLVGGLLGPHLRDSLRTRLEAFRIPSGAMEPTLLIGDFLYVVKTPAARADVSREGVVVFESVEEPGLKVIKRVVGLPGDTLMMAGGALHRNGRPLDEPFAVHSDRSRSEDPDQRAKMRSWQVLHTIGLDTATYAPDLQDWGPLVVSADSFFALGDNRDASYDSRYYGFVPVSRVLGRPRVIYLSLALDTTGAARGVRWTRMGKRVR